MRWGVADEIVDFPVSGPLPTLVPGLHPERELLGPEFGRIADEQYPKWQASARLRTLVPVRLCSALPLLYRAEYQALTLSILLGWISYVIALSQAGKSSLVVEALKGNTARGLGVFMSMAGGKFYHSLIRLQRSPAGWK
jgi:hypothetical protein